MVILTFATGYCPLRHQRPAQPSHTGFVNATIAPSERRCASRTSNRAKARRYRRRVATATGPDQIPLSLVRTQPSVVINATFVPGAPLIKAVIVTCPSAPYSQCLSGAGYAAARTGRPSESSATSRDRARYERPQRNPSTIAGVDSSPACTTVCGEPTG